MTDIQRKLVNLKEIEGTVSPHSAQVERALKARQEALEYVTDVAGLADFLGGKVENLGIREDWAIRKDIYPGVVVYFIYNRG